jgi:CRP-like cAMP-binding protein
MEVISLNLAYFLTFIALAIREIFWLRIIITMAQFAHVLNAYMTDSISKGAWTVVFITINIYQIIMIILDRRQLAIPDEIKDLYKNIFHTKSNREFLQFWDRGKVCQIEEEVLVKTGDTQADLMLILNGTANVIRKGKKIATLERGQFIAEISYITGKPASADIIPENELIFYTWDRDTLNDLRKKNPGVMRKLDSILTLDMAEKLIR